MTLREWRTARYPACPSSRSLAGVVSLALLLASPAAAQQAAPEPDELRLRLERAEARIADLEELVRRQSDQLQALMPASASAKPAGPSPATAEASAAKPPIAAAEAPPERPITHPLLSVKFNGLVQAWYFVGNQGLSDTFRIRRTELYFTGQVTNKARWQVMIDPAKALALETTLTPVNGVPLLSAIAVGQASRILQNAFVSLDYIPKLQMNIGQYKLPLSLEGLQSSGQLETVERALFASDRARGGNYGDVRDIGFMLRGGVGPRVDFQAGVFNSIAETQNTVDVNDEKALAGRLVARPVTGLHLGMSGAWDNGGGARPRRDRLGGELEYKRGAFQLKSELMTGEDGPLHRRGFYAHVGYRFKPKLEWVFRVDGWDPDTASEDTPLSVSELDYVTGFNVFLSKHNLKLQVNYLRKTFGSDALESRNVLLVNTQTFW